ncbi:hypothetical protein HPP92_024126 [Vanilla planifolia]|uniref:Pentatricopeptide repeat-containing protein n=1 Tax=Vanilla planifolia TaxID=51239 RepID=A0A835PKA9_VANPL|nr:hypothetical protein HPP92_024126 [Vanilla planifolia]
MEEDGSALEPCSYAYAVVLKSCIIGGEPYMGKAVHCHALKRGKRLDLFCRNILLDLYVKLGLLVCANMLFEEMPDRNMVSFVSLIQGHMKCGNYADASKLFFGLYREGTSLIESYSLCGLVDDARGVFEAIKGRDIVVWTGMVSCYSENEFADEALLLFSEMMQSGFLPNNYTLSSLLKASVSLSSLKLGKSIHGCAIKCFYESDDYVGGALLDMYAKCGDIEDARLVFNKVSDCGVILWSFMIARYAQSDRNSEALDLFQRMTKSSIVPNEYSFSSILQACANINNLSLGEQVHGHVIKLGLESEIFVANALMDVYAKCSDLDALTKIFSMLCLKNDVSWNTMIVGHVQSGFAEYALQLFRQMRFLNIRSTEVTYSSVLRACASIAAIELAGQIHALVMKTPFNDDNAVSNSLVDSYAKCGNILYPRKVFDLMKEHDVISWNSLISGYAVHGLGIDALSLFRKMIDEGTKANGVTFVGVLSACSNMGLVNEGQHLFSSMTQDYGIEPSMEHYTCMVRLFDALDCLTRQ